VWSHQLLNYDEQLSGVPDYMVAKRSAKGKIMFEAKKDNFEEGWGQCLAELITAQKLNQNIQTEIFGIVSNGKFWELGRLLENSFEKNIKLYTISNLEELFAAVNYVFQKSQSSCL
jgi:roadblock/LC7 domain-containing protein